MRARRAVGFTLVELIIAIALSSAAMLALTAVFMPMVRTQLQSMNDLRSQGDAMSAHKGLIQSLRDASEIYSPLEDAGSNVLSGCVNYDTALGGRIDDGQQVKAFYYCVANGKLYYHTVSPAGSPCKMTVSNCASGFKFVLAGNVSPVSGQAYFVRPKDRRGVVEVRYQVAYGTATQQTASLTTVDAAVSFQSPSEEP